MTFQQFGENIEALSRRGDEQTQLPGDDFRNNAHRFQPIDKTFAEAEQFDAVIGHYAYALDVQTVLERETDASFKDIGPRACSVDRFHRGRCFIPDPSQRDKASDNAFARIRLEAINPTMLIRKPFPDREQQSRNDMHVAVGKRRDLCHLAIPGIAERRSIRVFPMGLVQGINGVT